MKNLVVSTLLTLVILQASVSAAPTTDAQLEAAIKATDVFKTKKFKVGIIDKEVQISTYPTSTVEQDLKIETILVSRTIIEKFPEVARVAVNYYGDKTGSYRQVVVTKPEIIAFGSGKVTDGELLSAIRIEEKTDTAAAAAAEKEKQEKIAKAEISRSHTAENAKEVYKQAVAKGENPEAQWTTYRSSGISFQYPAVWRISREQEGETLVSLRNDQLTTHGEAKFELKLYQREGNRPVMEIAREHASRHMRYPGFTPTVKSSFVNLGVGNTIKGVCENFSSLNGKSRFFERHIYFGWPGYVYKVMMKSSKEDYNHVNSMFQHLISTIRIESAPSPEKSGGREHGEEHGEHHGEHGRYRGQ